MEEDVSLQACFPCLDRGNYCPGGQKEGSLFLTHRSGQSSNRPGPKMEIEIAHVEIPPSNSLFTPLTLPNLRRRHFRRLRKRILSMWNEIAAAQEVLYLFISEPLMNLDAKHAARNDRHPQLTLMKGFLSSILGTQWRLPLPIIATNRHLKE
jgi:hypothetical protein